MFRRFFSDLYYQGTNVAGYIVFALVCTDEFLGGIEEVKCIHPNELVLLASNSNMLDFVSFCFFLLQLRVIIFRNYFTLVHMQFYTHLWVGLVDTEVATTIQN